MRISEFKKLCEEYGYKLVRESDNAFKIFIDEFSGIILNIHVENEYKFNFSFLIRTHDIIHHGDRTDIHIIVSQMFSVFLKNSQLNLSCSIYEMPHPIIENEVYGCFVIPEQFGINNLLGNKFTLNEKITALIIHIKIWSDIFWTTFGCPCSECISKVKENSDETLRYDTYNFYENILIENFRKHYNNNFGYRKIPEWIYLYNFDNSILIGNSQNLCKYLNLISQKEKSEALKTTKGIFYFNNTLNYFVKKKDLIKIKSIFKSINKDFNFDNINLNFIENYIIINDSETFVSYKKEIGKLSFKYEKEKIREQHNLESELLFPIYNFEWHDKVCPNQFESLIKELLERENNITWVKKPAPLNQGDKGRDLIIDVFIKDENKFKQDEIPFKKIKVVGQCKAFNKSVGTSDVCNIRDTVELHDSEGYFLAVSSQLTLALTETLEKLRNKMWVDWWNREDIESRLNRNQDLIPLFPKVFKTTAFYKKISK